LQRQWVRASEFGDPADQEDSEHAESERELVDAKSADVDAPRPPRRSLLDSFVARWL